MKRALRIQVLGFPTHKEAFYGSNEYRQSCLQAHGKDPNVFIGPDYWLWVRDWAKMHNRKRLIRFDDVATDFFSRDFPLHLEAIVEAAEEHKTRRRVLWLWDHSGHAKTRRPPKQTRPLSRNSHKEQSEQ